MYLQEQIENIIGMVAYQRFRLYTKVMVDRKRIDELRPLMDAISPTFCMAKWHHTTIYLQTGETHSCYHPAPHKIDEKRIGWDPSALHNTEEKKAERRALLNKNWIPAIKRVIKSTEASKMYLLMFMR